MAEPPRDSPPGCGAQPWTIGGRVVLQKVEPLTTLAQRTRGLLGRGSLPPGQAVWISPCSAIHTIGMSFPIDAIFLDSERRVVRIERDIDPWRMAWGGTGAESVLEVQSGWLAAGAVAVGDRFSAQVPA